MHNNQNWMNASTYSVNSSERLSRTDSAEVWHGDPAGLRFFHRQHPWWARRSHRRSWSARRGQMQPLSLTSSWCCHMPDQWTDNAIHYRIKKINKKPPHQNHFMDLFPGPPGWIIARGELLDFIVQSKTNNGRHIDHPTGRHSIQTNQCPPPPYPIFYRPDAFLPPNQ